VIGTIIFPPLGGLIAAPFSNPGIGILAFAEYPSSLASTAWHGFLVGDYLLLFRFAIGLVVIGLWWMWVWKG